MKSRRDGTRIIFEILSICKEGASKTRVVYQVNLNSLLAAKYLTLLVGRELLFQFVDSDEATLFATTEKGERLLNLLIEAKRHMEGLVPRLVGGTL